MPYLILSILAAHTELGKMGYQASRPDGAFYLFIKSPISDDVEFVRMLAEEQILGVPGRGFGRAGYFRLSFCVKNEVIVKSLAGFKKTILRCSKA